MISFDVHGTLAGQGSKRSYGAGRMVESSPRVKPWREAVKTAALDHRRIGDPPPFPAGPLTVDIVVYVPRAKSHYGTGRNAGRLKDHAPGHPCGTPDIDKVARACLDGITGVLWANDSQVSALYISKAWAQDHGRPPGARIRILERGAS